MSKNGIDLAGFKDAAKLKDRYEKQLQRLHGRGYTAKELMVSVSRRRFLKRS